MTYQKTTGTLSPGGHPGSYNGQDAWNDMLEVNDGNHNDKPQQYADKSKRERCGSLTCGDGLQRPADRAEINRGGYEMNEQKTTSVVRRLTPTECSRLQGYPDGWVDIGEWTDSKGKLHKESDSAKYKALSNSIALPFWFWLLRRISAQYERPATLGSLFDGIGGFPLCWEKCNGKGTAIWASEIEEFCIAVTKERFK